jgi:hypothetical protein
MGYEQIKQILDPIAQPMPALGADKRDDLTVKNRVILGAVGPS